MLLPSLWDLTISMHEISRGRMKEICQKRPIVSDPLTVEMIQESFQGKLRDGEEHGSALLFSLYFVIAHFLGKPWVGRHVMYGAAYSGYLTNKSEHVSEDGFARNETHFERVLQLADNMLNLQDIDGFGECLDRLFSGQIEPTMTELDFGMFMRMQGTKFRYVVTSGVKQQDYDVELTYPDGTIACAEAKCKLDGGAFTESGFLKTLKEARKQLPKDKPGVAFLKIPQEWVDEESGEIRGHSDAKSLLDGYFRTTKRIVCVVLYGKLTSTVEGCFRVQHVFRQFENPSNRFPAKSSWVLFDQVHSEYRWHNLIEILSS